MPKATLKNEITSVWVSCRYKKHFYFQITLLQNYQCQWNSNVFLCFFFLELIRLIILISRSNWSGYHYVNRRDYDNVVKLSTPNFDDFGNSNCYPVNQSVDGTSSKQDKTRRTAVHYIGRPKRGRNSEDGWSWGCLLINQWTLLSSTFKWKDKKWRFMFYFELIWFHICKWKIIVLDLLV